jgi:hypothetical protein
VKVLEFPLIVYLLELFLYAVRVTTMSDFGTTSNSSRPGCTERKPDKGPQTVFPYQIDDLTEVHFDTAVVEVFVIGGVVNELGELPLTHLGCSPAENKEESVDSVRLA